MNPQDGDPLYVHEEPPPEARRRMWVSSWYSGYVYGLKRGADRRYHQSALVLAGLSGFIVGLLAGLVLWRLM